MAKYWPYIYVWVKGPSLVPLSCVQVLICLGQINNVFDISRRKRYVGIIRQWVPKYYVHYLFIIDSCLMFFLITVNNVTSILSIADKYLNDPLKMKCQKVMQLWLDDLHIRASKVKLYEQPEYVMTMFTLLKAAIAVSALGVIHRAQTFIASFGSILFIGPLWRKAEYSTGSYATILQKQRQEECCKMFQDLPAEIQSKILQFRLRKTDFNEYLLNKK